MLNLQAPTLSEPIDGQPVLRVSARESRDQTAISPSSRVLPIDLHTHTDPILKPSSEAGNPTRTLPFGQLLASVSV